MLKRKERFGTMTTSSDSVSVAVCMHLFCMYCLYIKAHQNTHLAFLKALQLSCALQHSVAVVSK